MIDFAALLSCTLHRRTPHAIGGVVNSQMSIARHYGGLRYNGENYVYIPADDTLVRVDVLKWLKARAKAEAKARKPTRDMHPELSFEEDPR